MREIHERLKSIIKRLNQEIDTAKREYIEISEALNIP